MKLRNLVFLAEAKYIDSPKEGYIFNDNGKDYFISKISGKNVTVNTFNVKDKNTIVLDKKDIKLDKDNLEMKGSMDVISFEKCPYPSVMDEKEWKDFVKNQKREAKKMTKAQYNKIIKGAAEDMRGDDFEATFDVAQNLAKDPKIRQFAKAEYGRAWMQQIQYDLEENL